MAGQLALAALAALLACAPIRAQSAPPLIREDGAIYGPIGEDAVIEYLRALEEIGVLEVASR